MAYYTRAEVAAALGVTERTVRTWADDLKMIGQERLGGKFSEDDLVLGALAVKLYALCGERSPAVAVIIREAGPMLKGRQLLAPGAAWNGVKIELPSAVALIVHPGFLDGIKARLSAA